MAIVVPGCGLVKPLPLAGEAQAAFGGRSSKRRRGYGGAPGEGSLLIGSLSAEAPSPLPSPASGRGSAPSSSITLIDRPDQILDLRGVRAELLGELVEIGVGDRRKALLVDVVD